MSNLDWKIVCLELDEESKEVGKFLEGIWPSKVSSVVIKDSEDIIKREHLRDLLSDFSAKQGRIFTVYGSGVYHHFTHGLLEVVADARSQNYAYVHVDQHTDNYDIHEIGGSGEVLNCANFVSRIPVNTRAIAVKYVGCKKQFVRVRQSDIVETYDLKDKGVGFALERLLRGTPFDIYASIDLDVLKRTHIKTGWTRGNMDVGLLLDVVKYLKSNKNILSADALGLCCDIIERYAELIPLTKQLWDASLLVYAMLAGTILGEDINCLKEEHDNLTKQ